MMTLLFNCFFTLRRLSLLIIAVLLCDYPSMQLMLYQLISLMNLMYVAYWQPYEEHITNRIECFNEFSVLMMSNILIVFTEYETDQGMRDMAGYAILGMILINFIGNFSCISASMYFKFRDMWRRRAWYISYLKLKIRGLCPKKAQQAPENFIEEVYNYNETHMHLFQRVEETKSIERPFQKEPTAFIYEQSKRLPPLDLPLKERE